MSLSIEDFLRIVKPYPADAMRRAGVTIAAAALLLRTAARFIAAEQSTRYANSLLDDVRRHPERLNEHLEGYRRIIGAAFAAGMTRDIAWDTACVAKIRAVVEESVIETMRRRERDLMKG
jgi:hypothetical protein